MLPSLNFEQKVPDLQSASVVHVSHSPPLLQPARGSTARTKPAIQRDRRERIIRFQLLATAFGSLPILSVGRAAGKRKSLTGLRFDGPARGVYLNSFGAPLNTKS